MVLTLSIMAIIVAFSLYDYFSSRSWQMVTSKERNETVFENRNKEYGAYQIRRDYDKRILLIFLGFAVGIGALWGASSLFKPLEQRKPTEIPMDTWTAKPIEDEAKPEIPQPEIEKPAAPTLADITAFPEIKIEDNPDIEIKPIVEPGKEIGLIPQKGDPEGIWDKPIIPSKGGGTGTGTELPPIGDPVPWVDEPAQFPGGMEALREFIAENIDLNMIDGSSKVFLKFVVDTDGTISSVMVTKTTEDCKSCEKAAIKVVKSMPNWKPGKLNGREVKSYYRLPINIQ